MPIATLDARHESSNLDLLRSTAVLFVVGFHVMLVFEQNGYLQKERLRGLHSIGNWGVLVFFVHTTLVLMFSLEREHNLFPKKPDYIAFLTRRIFRIFPLSIAIVLSVAILKLPVGALESGHFSQVHVGWAGFLANLFLVQNLSHTESIIVPLWSLPYEMQMYFLLPPLYLFARSVRGILPVVVLWGLAVFAAMHSVRLERFGFPDLLKFIPCFLPGIVAYKLAKTRHLNLSSALWPVAVAALTILYLLRPSSRNGWMCCLLLGVAIPQFQQVTNLGVRRIAQIIARYSYGIYLTHFICIWFAFQKLTGIPLWARWLVLVSTCVVPPIVLYHVIEEPMIRIGKRVADRILSFTPLRKTKLKIKPVLAE